MGMEWRSNTAIFWPNATITVKPSLKTWCKMIRWSLYILTECARPPSLTGLKHMSSPHRFYVCVDTYTSVYLHVLVTLTLMIILSHTVICVLSVTSLHPFLKQCALCDSQDCFFLFWAVFQMMERQHRWKDHLRISNDRSSAYTHTQINSGCPGNLVFLRNTMLGNLPACETIMPTGMQLRERVLLSLAHSVTDVSGGFYGVWSSTSQMRQSQSSRSPYYLLNSNLEQCSEIDLISAAPWSISMVFDLVVQMCFW